MDKEVLEAQPEYLEDLGLVKGYHCPYCGGELELHHVDDAGTKWFRCKRCREYCNKPKSPEQKRLEEAIKPTPLSHLNMIEDPNLQGPVSVEAVVSSTSIAYLVPSHVEAVYEDRRGETHYFSQMIHERDPENIKLIGVSEDVKYRRLKRVLGISGDARIKENEWRTVYFVRVRPPVFTLEKRGEKIVDERGFEYKAYDIYVTSDRPISFKPSTVIRVEGITLPSPKNQKITLLGYKVEFPEEIQTFDASKLEVLRQKFAEMNVEERVNWILDNFEKYSQIVGRRNLAFAGLLCYFTPTWIRFNGEIQRGWGNIMIIGDTTTAKSETIRKLIMLLKAGMLITAETASTVGLIGTATQVEKEGWFVDWGFLVLCDRKLLAVDGAHKLSLSNWAALAEAERSGVVTIAKAAKNSAYARTRQIKIANPVDKEANKYTTKTLSAFLYPCQALTTVLDKTSIARLDLAVFSDSRDVSPNEINRKFDGDYDPDLELLREVLKWCWSDTAEVKFTEEAIDLLLNSATDLYETFFYEEIPLASIDLKWKLARLSAALAFMTLSTEDYHTVTVTKDHVRIVVDFIKTEYANAGLNTLAQAQRYEILTKEEADTLISKICEETDLEREEVESIIEFIVLRGRVTRDEIRTKFGLSENKQLRSLLSLMSSEGLIRSGRGLYSEPKLIQLYRIIKDIKVIKVRKEPLEKLEENRESYPFNSKLDNLDNLDDERPRRPVLGRGCYDCVHFEPASPEQMRMGLAGRCAWKGKWLMDATISTIIRVGCDGFELRGDLGIRHWGQWDKKERDETNV